ncbi:hypothetical protein [Streptomyces anulatus]|uniref:hypothetical protein n=1 Tax=Streptomyces anulatus TaxID=1892 RepID=UPI003659998C
MVRLSPAPADAHLPYVLLADLFTAFLAVVRADEHDLRPGPDDPVPLSCDEIRRLFITLVIRPVRAAAHRIGWSIWRRSRQA